MEEQTEVIEIPVCLARDERLTARAKALWMYLKSWESERTRFKQVDLCQAIGTGPNRRELREAVQILEEQGRLTVDRSHKPHTYTLS